MVNKILNTRIRVLNDTAEALEKRVLPSLLKAKSFITKLIAR